ncbi:hypothetical protein [Thalassotalea marina]|uniref:Uncharacterized protein n=1 Tax=Thalassotalea marina TaxID=1673741 RepID=A0A919BL00_9GAMM|nr:hypothetical protein [Thalassotalea marina]GHF94345.1 hypothetical protein GCM10017161_23230 [Thalassotalea marina]
MNSIFSPLIKLALLVLSLAFGVILSVSIITKESQANTPVVAHATPFAKALNNGAESPTLQQQIEKDINRLTPGHRDYDQEFVKALLVKNNNMPNGKVDLLVGDRS